MGNHVFCNGLGYKKEGCINFWVFLVIFESVFNKCSVDKAKASRAWAALIKKVYELDPLLCPKCQSPMRIVSFITDSVEISKIMKHLGIPPYRAPPAFEDRTQYSDDYFQAAWIQAAFAHLPLAEGLSRYLCCQRTSKPLTQTPEAVEKIHALATSRDDFTYKSVRGAKWYFKSLEAGIGFPIFCIMHAAILALKLLMILSLIRHRWWIASMRNYVGKMHFH